MSEITSLGAMALAAAIRKRQVSPSEALDACLARVDAVNDRVNAVVWRNDDDARAAARAATEAMARVPEGELPPFHGVPIPIKDLTPVAGWPVTYGSDAAPAGVSPESALVVEAFVRAGFVLSGRTNTPEFGPIPASENRRYGPSRNPWALKHTPGGSSGGAAAATAARMFPLAHGNDGGGSIRIPASCCGLVGLKVSRGRVPNRYTSWEGGSVEGVITRDVADTAAVLDVISGPDPLCWYNAPAPRRPFACEVGADPGRLRVGLLTGAPLGLEVSAGPLAATRRVGLTLEGLGHRVAEVAVDMHDDMVVAFTQVVNTGLADYEGIDWERTEPHIQANRRTAMSVHSLTYVKAVHDLQRFTRMEMARWGREFDVLVTPTMTIEPPVAGEVLAAAHEAAGGIALPVLQMAALTSMFNISGQPALSLPVELSAAGLPVGVQVVGGPFDEVTVLRLAAQLEAELGWAGRFPEL